MKIELDEKDLSYIEKINEDLLAKEEMLVFEKYEQMDIYDFMGGGSDGV